IAVQGATRSTTDSLLYQAARSSTPLAAVASRPVFDWLVPILSTSQNWFAEMLLKQLGRQLGAAGSWDEGLRVTRRFLIDSVGVDSTQFSLRDGSGLSTVDLVTPAAFVRLLTWIRRHQAYPVFAAGLPVAGETGTLRSRFVGTRLEGRVIAKTGTLTSGNTLSGYLERPKGGMLVFSIQANHHAIGGRAMVAAIDSALAIIGR
ncbi:MAG: D-alanyl-D-alanine carboxypeptidase/D-alanyl-D-alanine-endopeptidase, partial [Gemmatimonadota bacterium]